MATLVGSNLIDTLIGTDESDVIYGGLNTDTLIGGVGDDYIADGDADGTEDLSSDILQGNAGNDTLIGHRYDILEGGDGNDSLVVAASDFYGTFGSTVNGGDGNDTLSGAPYGNGILVISVDGASINGGDGDDFIHMPGTDSTLHGGAGNDTLIGGFVSGIAENGFDYIYGDDGNDTLYLYGTAMTVEGGAGADIFTLPLTPVYFGFSKSTITDFTAGTDKFDINLLTESLREDFAWAGSNPFADGHMRFLQSGSDAHVQVNLFSWVSVLVLKNVNAAELISGEYRDDIFTSPVSMDGVFVTDLTIGTSGDDTLTGHEGNDTFIGVAGNDIIKGNDGNDSLYGEEGNDTLNGGNGNDTLYGGSGNDIFFAGSGDDILRAGAGNDWLGIGQGNDTLTSGNGNDRYVFQVKFSGNNIATLTDFNSRTDDFVIRAGLTNIHATGVLSENLFHTGSSAGDANDRFIYDSTNGTLYYDRDGNGAAEQTQFAKLGNGGVALTHADFIIS